MIPNCQRYFRNCDAFTICCNISESNNIISEHHDLGYLLYHIGVKGVGRVGIPFSSDYKPLDAVNNNLVNMKEWIDEHKIYTTDEHSELYGFNSLNRDQDWDARIIRDSFDATIKDWLVCFKGMAVVNGKPMKKLDYAKLDEKHYDVYADNSLLVLFTKK